MWLFYLIVFLIPSNLAKHFILPSSYVSGYLVDYLIPTLYLTDILIILLLIIKPIKTLPKTLIVFLLCLLPAVILAASPIPAVYKWLKFLELGLLGVWIRQYRPRIAAPLVAAIIFQSLLALGQWFHQGSLFGYWFLGEQPYTQATPGIDQITWFNGSLKIPPLGTTPHPNVLAGFLVVATYFWKDRILPFLAAIPLFLTFSLSGWLAFLIRNKWALAATVAVLLVMGKNLSFLAPETSFSRRSQLTNISLKMFQDRPLTGVGLNNFTVVMDRYGYVPATTRFLQPVHNIYLLILSETGLIGALGFLYLILQGLSLKAFKERPLWILLFLGLFDHYPLTLQTGLLLFILTLY
ncbi:O-antigen ligase family protein [Patescibacteria group bacterium]|nr:O-antigen ligase family protein [Patescibacteria group bacterium]